MADEKYLTTEEVAEKCRTSPETVRKWRHQGVGPAGFRAGRRILYSHSAVEEWAANGGTRGEPQPAA
jgi:excisionase family DNA binding protein